MRIGIENIAENPVSPTAGATYMKKVLPELAKLDRENEYFIFVSPVNRAFYWFESENFHWVECWASNERRLVRILSQQVQLPRLVAQLRLDVLHCPSSQMPLSRPCLTVLNIKTLQHLDYEAALGYTRSYYRKAIITLSARRADRIIANTYFTKKVIQERIGVPESKVDVVYEGVDLEDFAPEPDPAALRERLAKRGLDFPYFLYVSTFRAYKNQLGLLEAYRLMVDQERLPHHLVFVGTGPEYMQQVRRRAAELGLADCVHFHGYEPHPEIVDFYRGASVFIYPSFYETFGLPILEAMSCGVPVVTSNVSSMPEVAGDAAETADPRDPGQIAEATLRLLGDEDLRRRRVARGLDRAREFTWRHTAEGTLRVFNRVAGQAATAR